MKPKRREVGIVGCGMSRFSSHREEVNQPEMVHEAVVEALADAGISMAEVDCVLHGNMELFEMVHQPDMWHALGTGVPGKAGIRLTTGGTTGATLACAADNLVASGLHDFVLAIGFEKLQEGHATGGISNMADPLWGRKLQAGALTGTTAQAVIDEFGAERARNAAMKLRVIMDEHAMLNDKAHRRFGLERQFIKEMADNSPPLVGELRMIHMCSQSDGACAVIFASEEKIAEKGWNAAWIVDHETVHREETLVFAREKTTHRVAAERLYARNGITNPRAQIDVFEMYDPSAWWGLDWIREFLLLEGDEHLKMVENDEVAITGSFPINPSGGVMASNPIGATALVRVAEAALQVRGAAGQHQVPKPVNLALASGFGGTLWTVLMLLSKDKPSREVSSTPHSPLQLAARNSQPETRSPSPLQLATRNSQLETNSSPNPQSAIHNPQSELILSRQVLSIPQRFATGPIMGRFLRELRDNKRILALRCKKNGRFLLPPREVDAWSMTEGDEWVEVGPEGAVRDFDIVYYASPDPLTGETREVPYVIAWIQLDGVEGDAPLWHLLKVDDLAQVHSGLRVRAVFAEHRHGAMEDIQHFEALP
ncbi:MAG: OB-fold domain-containing protein [Candidatus Hydrogenedentes bacterium]|nr:OB-fold domain-containing protein [Candidatus Hydrogenedentota bacterium]